LAKVWWLLFRDTVYIHLFISAVDTPSKSDIIRYNIGHNSQHSQLLSIYTRVTCPRVSVHRSVMLYTVRLYTHVSPAHACQCTGL